MRRLLKISLLLLLAPVLQLSAADDTAPDQRSCIDIADSQQRLDCYDAALGRNAASAESGPVDDAPPTPEVSSGVDAPAAKVVETEKEVETEKVVEVEKVIESEAPPVAVKAKDSIGLPERVSEPPAKPEEDLEADAIIALVTRVSRRARGQHVVYLDNEQVWSEPFSSRYFPVKAGDTVTIKKRRFSGYRLVAPTGKAFAVERLR